MKKSVWLELCCALLILLFLYASLIKYTAFSNFKHDMYNQPFPHWISSIFIWTVPPTEIAIAIFLSMSKYRKWGLIASLALMSLFTLYTALILFHAFPRVPCSCGGVIKHLSWTQHLFLNIFYVGISISGLILCRKTTKQNLETVVIA